MATQQKNSLEIINAVDAVEVEPLIREYKQRRWKANSERIGKPDSLSAWYNIQDLEDLLDSARSVGGDGVKIYFAAYPEDYSPKPEYAGRQTLVMVATKSKYLKSGVIANKDVHIIRNGQSKILSTLNPPSMCPPHCSPNSEGGMGDLGIAIIDNGDKGMEIV